MNSGNIIDFPIRRPLPTGERQRTRQSAADRRALVLPHQVRGTFSNWLGLRRGKHRHAHESGNTAGLTTCGRQFGVGLPGSCPPQCSGAASYAPRRSDDRPVQANLFRCPLGSTAVAGLVPPSTSPAPSNPPPASTVDDIVAAWLASLSEAS